MNRFNESQKYFFNKLQVGQKIPGKIKQFTRFGVFVNIGLIDGLLGLNEITWGRLEDAEDFLKKWQKVDVIVLKKDEQKQNIFLGMKQLLPHPWEVAQTKYREGDTVIGHVTDVQPYGAFLEIMPGFEGLVHVSEISETENIENVKKYFQLGQAYEAKIISLDFEKRKMGLSIK